MDEDKPKCPACEHKLESIYSYPLIKINSFERAPLPGYIIGGQINDNLTYATKSIFPFFNKKTKILPREVQNFFENNPFNEMYWNGSIFMRDLKWDYKNAIKRGPFKETVHQIPAGTFSQYKNIMPEIKPLIDNGVMGEHLNWLESQVGKVIRYENLSKKHNEIGESTGLSLSIRPPVMRDPPGFDDCFYLTLDKGEWSYGSISSWESEWFSDFTLARLNLEGMLNNSIGTIVRPKNWNQVGDTLRYLCDKQIPHRLLGFGCVEISSNIINDLNNQGYELEHIDFNRLLQDKAAITAYDEFAAKKLGLE